MPQLDIIAQLTPMPSAPPAGKAFATALELRLTTAASRSRSAGSTAQIMNQYETRLAAAAVATSSACPHVIASTLAHTLRYEANRGRANPNTAAMRATETTVRTTLRARRGRVVAIPASCCGTKLPPVPLPPPVTAPGSSALVLIGPGPVPPAGRAFEVIAPACP